MRVRQFLLAAMLSLVAGAVSAQTIDAARSSVSATFKQMGVPVEGKFKKIGGQVSYDAANPAAARAQVDVDIASFDLGDPQYNREVQQKDWFDGARFPAASFVSTGVKAAGAGRFEVSGKLTIKGRSVNVSVPLSARTDGGATVFEGSVPVRRLAFSIGEGEWKDTALLADEVVIKFRLAVPAGK